MAPTRKDLANILATLPYGVLAVVAKELVEMNLDSECNRHPETVTGMAETLYDWGEANAGHQLETERMRHDFDDN